MEVLEAFLKAYWAWSVTVPLLIALGVAFIVTAGFLRHPAMAVGIAGFGLYASLAIFLMRTYESFGLTVEWAMAIVVGATLVVASMVYYVIFVRG